MANQSKKAKTEEKPDESKSKREPGSLDDHYSNLYLDTPWKQHKELYLEACELAGVTVAINVNQAAYELHKRLKPKLGDLLRANQEDDMALGRATMRKLCKGAESESVKGQMASTLAKGLYPDHVVTKDMTLEEVDRELAAQDKEEEALRKPH